MFTKILSKHYINGIIPITVLGTTKKKKTTK